MALVTTVPERLSPWNRLWALVRPVAGPLFALLGAAALFLGWYGVSGTPVPAKQLPYLVSGGLTGVSLVVLAAAFFATEDVRRQLADLQDVAAKVDRLYALLTEPEAEERVTPVVVDGGTSLHRPTCRLVAGKAAREATESEVAGRTPCRVCRPDA